MLLAGIACILGIIVENLKWPQDRTAMKVRFLESRGLGQGVWLLVGLVLGHSVVRWLVALALASIVVLLVLGAPPILAAVRAAKDEHDIPLYAIDLATGAVITTLMVAFAVGARRLAR